MHKISLRAVKFRSYSNGTLDRISLCFFREGEGTRNQWQGRRSDAYDFIAISYNKPITDSNCT